MWPRKVRKSQPKWLSFLATFFLTFLLIEEQHPRKNLNWLVENSREKQCFLVSFFDAEEYLIVRRIFADAAVFFTRDNIYRPSAPFRGSPRALNRVAVAVNIQGLDQMAGVVVWFVHIQFVLKFLTFSARRREALIVLQLQRDIIFRKLPNRGVKNVKSKNFLFFDDFSEKSAKSRRFWF